ncbi:hypothetical protein JAAARDRAFT_154623 [Jaapia argillacea MUCL 33604]|uniref:LsmAD domain-containing protein n=1 Tax=Jaapia argillacea MUCL 33604 TaxID=933084 RepID=A0A067Q707_9AGAM|nr:hypothetical protein JAAARDRAFT_154623 [Jaapia argillacea MUCL 33604]
MATTTRQPKPTRKGETPTPRRPAWGTGGRASPAFSPGVNSVRLPSNTNQGPFASLAQTNGTRTPDPHDRVLQALSGLTGTTITLLTKTGQRYEGVVASTSGEGDTKGVSLKDVKEVSIPGATAKERLFIACTNIDTWTSGPADAKPTNGDTFKTDTDISQTTAPRKERELRAWADDIPPDMPPASGNFGAPHTDDITFGPGASNNSWDQFAANEKLFGVKTQFDEDVYTTKLDRSHPDFKERERKAQQIANEIMGGTTNNVHIAEERKMDHLDDSGTNEEEKYGAVVRGANAYVPPGARKLTPSTGGTPKPEVPKVSINAPDGSPVVQPPPSATQPETPPATTKATPPATNGAAAPANKPPADPLPAFRQFVTTEKQRLTQKRQALVKSEMDKRMAELLKFSQTFKLNKPIPEDLVPILAKDEEKQKQIREKSEKDAASTQARTIGVASSVVNASPPARLPQQPSTPLVKAPSTKATSPSGAAKPSIIASTSNPTVLSNAKPAAAATAKVDASKSARVSMVIQAIPPFKGKKLTPVATPTAPNGSTPSVSTTSSTGATASGAAVPPPSPRTARLNVTAPSFKPNPKAVAFTPGTASPNPSASPVSPKARLPSETPSVSSTPNPFFGRPIKKGGPVSIRDDFNPFKYNKVAEASAVSAIWPYNGKRYLQMFPPIQPPPQQQSPHMPPPGPPPLPPPTYEEDPAAQAARGYVYAYPPYGYPGQPMMQGMPPPPGAYMPSPFMQPMQYQPGMPPPNAMYASPSMGQMPPQAYMQPPPPGPYPPPPNSAGPRPSMPATPIPSHAHPYYHQSPQLQHAIPYPMMMQQGVPHPYEGAPPAPVPMGGHA